MPLMTKTFLMSESFVVLPASPIACASILAKHERDRMMVELDRRYPQYGFAGHKGYATQAHLLALRRLGPCHEHRRSFAPVRDLLAD